MSSFERRRRTNRARQRVLWGIALGQALEDNPRTGSPITHDRTLTLLPESATVTVTAP